ncbi:MAG: M20/M25/M40 family metallo-hydrolase [Planctomycetota bacterium]|nr:MAG: M20/M25/M40 family metallo-hydrolase [Planctomycetota bacterium]
MQQMTPLELAGELVRIDSVTTHPNEAITEALSSYLHRLRFDVRRFTYQDLQGVRKYGLEARRDPPGLAGTQGGVGYFCHSDVVPVDQWSCPHGGPFDAAVAEGRLWGRGACDMKGSIAAALAALHRIDVAEQHESVYFFVTGDEECGMAGAEWLVSQSEWFRDLVARRGVGIIGEPTLLQVVNAHKGGCRLDVVASGVAAHSSTRDGRNANWRLIPFLQELADVHRSSETDPAWQNPAFDPPTITLNPVLINVPAAPNITVETAICRLFFRPMPNTQVGLQEVKDRLLAAARRHGLQVAGLRELPPLFTSDDSASVRRLLQLLQQEQPLAVSYATDGCFLADLSERIVLGPGSIEQAHRPDEWIAVAELERGASVLERVFRAFICDDAA